MTDDRIKAVFEEYGRIVSGKEYALVHAIAEAVAPQKPWVGLTDADKQTAVWSDGSFGSGALWAEAKLKEKNSA